MNSLTTFVRRLCAISAISFFATVSAFAIAPQATIQDAPPDKLIKMVTEDVTSVIRQDRALYANDRTKLNALVEAKVVPFLNLERITRIAVGKSWRTATPEQQQMLISEFHQLLLNTYSNLLLNYQANAIDFRPLRLSPTDTDVTVHGDIKQQGGPSIAIDIDVEKTPSGWKVYNITVDGISFVMTYRYTFAEEIRKSGIDGLIRSLQEKLK